MMNNRLRWLVIAALFSLNGLSNFLLAQERIPVRRQYDGWATVSNPIRQTAYYQAPYNQSQGALSDTLPPLPADPARSGVNSSAGLGTGYALPTIPQSLPNSTPLPQAPVASRGDGFPSPTLLPPAYDGTLSSASRQPAQQPLPNNAGALPVMPPANQALSNNSSSEYSGTGTAAPRQVATARQAPFSPSPQAVQTIAYQSGQSPGIAGNRLREIDNASSMPSGSGRYDPNTITTGPPFVSQAPQSRYPTSPYNRAFFQTVAFQRTQAAVATAASPTTAPLLNTQQPYSQIANTQPTLPPQFATGIYPTAYQCQPGPSFPAAGVQTMVVPGTVTPDLAPTIYSSTNAGLRPLFSLGQENYNVQLGRGIVGQPTVYVPGQPIRNFFRYIFP